MKMPKLTIVFSKAKYFNEKCRVSISYRFNKETSFKSDTFQSQPPQQLENGHANSSCDNENNNINNHQNNHTNTSTETHTLKIESNHISTGCQCFYKLYISSSSFPKSVYYFSKFEQTFELTQQDSEGNFTVTLDHFDENVILNHQKFLTGLSNATGWRNRRPSNYGIWQMGPLSSKNEEVAVSLKFQTTNGVILNHDFEDYKNNFSVEISPTENSRNLLVFSSEGIIQDQAKVIQNFKSNTFSFTNHTSFSEIRFRTEKEKLLNNTLLLKLDIKTPGENGEVLGDVSVKFNKSDKFLEQPFGRKKLKLMNGDKVMGDVRFDFVVITALEDPDFSICQNDDVGSDTRKTFTTTALQQPTSTANQLEIFLSQSSNRGFLSGHRGSGSSFKANLTRRSNVRENTIESFKKAFKNGANLVEFDVQITNDGKIVVYHDLILGINNTKTSVRANNYEFLKESASCGNIQSEFQLADDCGEMQFNPSDGWHLPLLEELFKEVPVDCGFNLEIKWPTSTLEKSNNYEQVKILQPLNYANMNSYLDEILKIVLRNLGTRKLVFSCFDTNICEMLTLKQSTIPVLYLILGEFLTVPEGLRGLDGLPTEAGYEETLPTSTPSQRIFYNGYEEKRSLTFNRAISFCKFSDFTGINTDVINFLEHDNENDSKKLVEKFNNNGLVISVYGRHMMEREYFKRALRVGIDQLIIDDDKEYSFEGRN